MQHTLLLAMEEPLTEQSLEKRAGGSAVSSQDAWKRTRRGGEVAVTTNCTSKLERWRNSKLDARLLAWLAKTFSQSFLLYKAGLAYAE